MTESPRSMTAQRVGGRRLSWPAGSAAGPRSRPTPGTACPVPVARCVVPTTRDGSATAGMVATTMSTAVTTPASGAPHQRTQPAAWARRIGRSTR